MNGKATEQPGTSAQCPCLRNRLAAVGVARHMLETAQRATRVLDEGAAEAIASFIMSQGSDDGGFRGREAKSDLYYTTFALQALAGLGRPVDEKRLCGFLAKRPPGAQLDFVHTACLARSLVPLSPGDARETAMTAALRRLEGFRAADGGYGQGQGESTSILHNCFLATLAYDAAGIAMPHADAMYESVKAFRRSGGGFANLPESTSALTTATAAGVVLSCRQEEQPAAETLAWLLARRRDGGFAAFEGAPIADLLSTATALYALRAAGQPLDLLRREALAFVESLWLECGGFCGSMTDDKADCEYTFYGLLAIGSLA